MGQQNPTGLSFFARAGLALACFKRAANPEFAGRLNTLLGAAEIAAPKAAAPESAGPPAGALQALAMLQREGRLIDFLQEDVAPFGDADLGAAARVVHEGCRKALSQCLTLEPAMKNTEGDIVLVAAGFDAQRVRLTGNVTGQPPFRGTLKHHGWVVASARWPSESAAMDPRVLAPAEVELA